MTLPLLGNKLNIIPFSIQNHPLISQPHITHHVLPTHPPHDIPEHRRHISPHPHLHPKPLGRTLRHRARHRLKRMATRHHLAAWLPRAPYKKMSDPAGRLPGQQRSACSHKSLRQLHGSGPLHDP
ncbi:hypothetical protein B0T17DRAFT_239546 [Bombardia bombarda]|uniref:Uncharacterized protein n=1 Tax=Bombardia bombarda TaxID=252184 RepID=A0AA39XBW4_9PEZI|nr:hypothetical protein B0T17DRAFT_239546 [Bombardia bombarda]